MPRIDPALAMYPRGPRKNLGNVQPVAMYEPDPPASISGDPYRMRGEVAAGGGIIPGVRGSHAIESGYQRKRRQMERQVQGGVDPVQITDKISKAVAEKAELKTFRQVLLADPGELDLLYRHTESQVGDQTDRTKQIFMERLANQAKSENKSISDLVGADLPKLSDEQMKTYDKLGKHVLNGSNLSAMEDILPDKYLGVLKSIINTR